MTKYGQPVISRETRLLLITIVVSIAALWVLARIRFQEQPVRSDPVPAVLAQLRPSAGYADLARAIAEIRPGIVAAVFADQGAAALRIREDAAVKLIAQGNEGPASDRATGLTIVQSPAAPLPGLMPWAPRLVDYPRYLVAAELLGEQVSLRPVFVGALFPTNSALWSGEIWVLPAAASIAPGTFVFTTDGAFAGLAVEHNNRTAIVPATLLLKLVENLLREGRRPPGEIGVTVQSLSPAIASASGAAAGMIVTAIDPVGPAAGKLIETDVIEGVDGQAIVTPEHWRARVARLHPGETVMLRVRTKGEIRDVSIAAVEPLKVPEESADPSLGLRLRAIPDVGAEVLSVQPRSRAARAGIRPGDVITVAGGQRSPTPAQIVRADAALSDQGSMLLAIARGTERFVAVIEK
jgi:PDZ domain